MAVQRSDNQVVGYNKIDVVTSKGKGFNIAEAWQSLTKGNNYQSGGSDSVERSVYDPIYGTLLNFSDVTMDGKTYSGTFNTFQDSAAQIQAAQNIFADPNALSLSDLNTAKSSNAATTNTNPFFSTFYNYYLGLAQDRQANLSKNLGRSDLLSNNTGSLL